MACMTLSAPIAITTTQLARAIRHEEASVWQEPRPERMSLRVSWVVASDRDGKRKLQMQWEGPE